MLLVIAWLNWPTYLIDETKIKGFDYSFVEQWHNDISEEILVVNESDLLSKKTLTWELNDASNNISIITWSIEDVHKFSKLDYLKRKINIVFNDDNNNLDFKSFLSSTELEVNLNNNMSICYIGDSEDCQYFIYLGRYKDWIEEIKYFRPSYGISEQEFYDLVSKFNQEIFYEI